MYYSVKLPEKDSNYLRFFWQDDIYNNEEPVEYRACVPIFGSKPAQSMALYALKKASRDGLPPGNPVADSIDNHFYVDDMLQSFTSVDIAVEHVNLVRKTLALKGFNINGFISNSKEVMCRLPRDILATNIENIDLLNTNESLNHTALGIIWNLATDSFYFKLRNAGIINTKRELLSKISSLFDPAGYLNPIIVTVRKLFQIACSKNVDWDEYVGDEIKSSYIKWLNQIEYLEQFSIPRQICCKNNTWQDGEIHIFCDGSEQAYGAVAYFRQKYNNRYKSNIIMSKARLVPINIKNKPTIPKIEVSAAHLGVQLYRKIAKSLKISQNKTFFWTDSQIVLQYLANNKIKFQRFVSNRISYILSHTQVEQWFKIQSDENPSDIISRGTYPNELIRNNLWLHGPSFLIDSNYEQYCLKFNQLPAINLNDPNVKNIASFSLVNKGLINNNKFAKIDLENNIIIKLIQSFSNFYKFKRRLVFILRVKNKFLKKNIDIKSEPDVSEYESAELFAIYMYQYYHFYETYNTLNSGKHLAINHYLSKLNLCINPNDNTIRVLGRLHNFHGINNAPLLLDGKSNLAILIARYFHAHNGHIGREALRASLRSKYWILNDHRLVKNITSNCSICRRFKANPTYQLMGNLPKARIQGDLPPFHNTGCDVFGPFIVRYSRGKTIKRYGLLFTCLASRAVHIELLYNLTTDMFFNALIRFCSRRGNVRNIYCDRGSNFIGAEAEIKRLWKNICQNTIERDLSKRVPEPVSWHFRPAFASFYGGSWERIIRSIRNILNCLLKEQCIKLTDDQLCTLFCQIEHILNNRPITYVSNDSGDFEALTPNHLLLNFNYTLFPNSLFMHDHSYPIKRWRQIQYLTERFWDRWYKYYLKTLNERQKWTTPRRNYAINDIVLIVDNFLLYGTLLL